MQAISRGLFTALQKHMDVYHWILRVEHYVGLGMSGFKLVGHWLHVPILCLMAAFAVYVVAYHLWCWRERGRLLGATQYASTSHGLVEYRRPHLLTFFTSLPAPALIHHMRTCTGTSGMAPVLLCSCFTVPPLAAPVCVCRVVACACAVLRVRLNDG